ncbi:MAG: hypothetical protein AB7O73_05970, partial [Bacteroidia bacterium]
MIQSLKATHIVGGEIYYDYLGGNKYKITLKLFRDCINGQPPFGGQGEGHTIVNIFNYNNELIQQVLMGEPVVTGVPSSANNPCMKAPESICVEQGVYEKIVFLPPNDDGYFLIHEICCRNSTILNLVNPSAQGSLYKTYIPGTKKGWGNSSPRYDNYPDIFICINE